VAETPKRCAQLRQAPDQQPGDDPLLLEQVQSSERSAAAPVECPRARNATPGGRRSRLRMGEPTKAEQRRGCALREATP
jgi:hypothetical protein